MNEIASSVLDVITDVGESSERETKVSPVTEAVSPPEVVRDEIGVDQRIEELIEFRQQLQEWESSYLKNASQLGFFGAISEFFFGDSEEKELAMKRSKIKGEFDKKTPDILKLRRYVSGLIENARIPQADKNVLQSHLTDLEAAFNTVRTIII